MPETSGFCEIFTDSRLLGRTIAKVMGGGGGGRGIFEPQEFFFRYQIPCMNLF